MQLLTRCMRAALAKVAPGDLERLKALATVPVPVPPPPTVVPPNCGTLQPQVLWPPNHLFVTVSIAGLGIASNYSTQITAVQQDEPVDALGSGNTAPDAIVSADQTSVQVRAERAGPGIGRIYFISFNAVDTTGNPICAGQAQVWVPHDMSPNTTVVDTGIRYDSTML